MGTHRETERKFEFGRDESLPALERLRGVEAVSGPHQLQLDAIYFDTEDRSLLQRGVTLRRRTGGHDSGWHLKRSDPSDPSSRIELRRPMDTTAPDPTVDDPVPTEFQDAVTAIVRGRPLKPIVRISTIRHEYDLVGSEGATAATLADDQVEARSLESVAQPPVTWRELEVELDNGPRRTLTEAEELLVAAGADRSPWPSKLARATTALGQRPPVPPNGNRRSKRKVTVRDVVFDHLTEQVDELIHWDPGVRNGEPEAVHKMRVATRRLRSALATFRKILDRTTTEPIRDELEWLGSILGSERDVDVLAAHLGSARKAVPIELLLGPVAARTAFEMSRRHAQAANEVRDALRSDRYFDLLDVLDDLLADPPLRSGASRSAKKGTRKPMRRAVHRVEKAVTRVGHASREADRLVALHDVRKAAKRARYAAEAVKPVWKKPAKQLAGRMERLQDLLGEHQDTVDSRAALRQLAVSAHLAHENGFTFGLLHEREAERSDHAMQDLPRAVRRALDPDRLDFLA